MPNKPNIEMGLAPVRPSRLYSAFPAGSVGLALLLLRLVDGLGLVGEGIRLLTPAGSSSEPTRVALLSLVLGASAMLLMLGLRTSLAGSAAAVCTGAAAVYANHHLIPQSSSMDAWAFLFTLVFFLSSSLALLGPGGYSLDARLSGWRMIRLSSAQSNSNTQKEGRCVDR
jgi:hypothetical protein